MKYFATVIQTGVMIKETEKVQYGGMCLWRVARHLVHVIRRRQWWHCLQVRLNIATSTGTCLVLLLENFMSEIKIRKK